MFVYCLSASDVYYTTDTHSSSFPSSSFPSSFFPLFFFTCERGKTEDRAREGLIIIIIIDYDVNDFDDEMINE